MSRDSLQILEEAGSSTMSGKKSTDPPSDHEDSASAQDDDSESDDEPIEYLAAGRAKRATAGNRMSSLVEREADEDLDLLFAEDEDEEDVEFEDEDDAASDAELGSSTDEEDQGPNKVEDELAGEKELQQQERTEQKKRKAQDVFRKPAALRKRVKIDESAKGAPEIPDRSTMKPKKKSERVSWLADGPTRTSSRKQTIKNREIVHKRLLDNEKQRAKVMRQMEEAQKRKDAKRAKPMTQAERLEEAAKTERKNAKSLNRWEEAEKKRAAEQKARLEALHNRQLTGPVISWWSGMARWVNDKIAQVGVREIRKVENEEQSMLANETKPSEEEATLQLKQIQPDEEKNKPPSTPLEESNQADNETLNHPAEPSSSPLPSCGILDGIHAYAALPGRQQLAEFTGTAHDEEVSIPVTHHSDSATLPTAEPPPVVPAAQAPPAPKLTPIFSNRNLVVLVSIDANAARLPELQEGVLLKKRSGKLHKPPAEHCAITAQPAKFRDPMTGLPYANAFAYGQVQRLQNGGSRWSNLLGCYVGSSQAVARGVPEGFWKTAG